jgi:hypothetical protein
LLAKILQQLTLHTNSNNNHSTAIKRERFKNSYGQKYSSKQADERLQLVMRIANFATRFVLSLVFGLMCEDICWREF